jgi:hypothetical protein
MAGIKVGAGRDRRRPEGVRALISLQQNVVHIKKFSNTTQIGMLTSAAMSVRDAVSH